MIGVILVSHAHIASETKVAIEYILNHQPMLEAKDILSSEHVSTQVTYFKEHLEAMLAACDGVLIMADILGATPCNIAMKAIARLEASEHVELVAGFNLPSVIKVMTERDYVNLNELVQLSIDAGQKYMRNGYERVRTDKEGSAL